MRRFLPSFLALTTIPLATHATSEVWVLNELSRDLSVIAVDTQTVTGSVALGAAAGTGPPSGLAFSTVPGSVGSRAFVTEGSVVHVLDADAKSSLGAVDLELELGFPVTLRDCDSGNGREYIGGIGTPEVQYHLFVAADAETGPGSVEPYYIVLDQEALSMTPPGPGVVVDSGPLNPPGLPAGTVGSASGVTVISPPDGPFFRAWFSITTEDATTSGVRNVLMGREEAAPGWVRLRTELHTTPLVAGGLPPVRLATPHDREMSLLPLANELIHLDDGEPCDLGGDLGPVAITGPAPGGYQIYAIERNGGNLLRVNDKTCNFDTFALGAEPVDLAVVEPFTRGPVYVANHGEDSVTLLDVDDSVTTIPLTMPAPDCVLCPVRVEARDVAKDKCDILFMVMSLGLVNANAIKDITLNWPSVDCPELGVYCQCNEEDSDCPCHCEVSDDDCFATAPPSTSSSFLLGGGPLWITAPEVPWIHLGNTVNNSFTHFDVGNQVGKWQYVVGPPPPPQ